MTTTLGKLGSGTFGAFNTQDIAPAKPAAKSSADLQSDVLEAARAESEIARAEKEEKLFAETETARQNVANREQYIKDLAQPEKRKALETQVAEKAKPFIPHQDNIDDLTKLFVTTNLMGFLLGGRGKMNAQAAMSAQNGMLEGHLKGNQDLYKREKDIFEENQKVLTQSIEQLRNELKDAAELAKNNYELAEQKTRNYIAKHGFTTLMPFYEKSKIVPTLSVVERVYKMAMDNEEKIRKENKDAYDRALEQAKLDETKRFHNIEQQKLNEANKGTVSIQNVITQDGKTVPVFVNNRTGQITDVSGKPFDTSQIQGIQKEGGVPKPAKPEAALGSGAFLESVIGVKAGDEKTNKSIVDTASGISQLNYVVNLFRDPEVRTGVVAKLNPLREKLASLGDDNHEISDQELKSIIDGEIPANAKNAVAQKEALFAAYTAEREIAGGRLLVSVVKQAGGALDPTNYEKSGYLNLLNSRENELKKRLRGLKMTDDQIDKVVNSLDQTSSTPTPTGSMERPRGVPANAQYSPSQHKWWYKDTNGEWQSKEGL